MRRYTPVEHRYVRHQQPDTCERLTLVSISFKNINWNGMLYASLLPGACQTGVADSLVLNVVGTPQGPVFVPDTTLCKGNTIVLHAGSVFSSYLWLTVPKIPPIR